MGSKELASYLTKGVLKITTPIKHSQYPFHLTSINNSFRSSTSLKQTLEVRKEAKAKISRLTPKETLLLLVQAHQGKAMSILCFTIKLALSNCLIWKIHTHSLLLHTLGCNQEDPKMGNNRFLTSTRPQISTFTTIASL